MLSAEHQALIKATIPLLEQGGEALITHFYQRLLKQHPQLRPLFNPAHQASGAQPRALAGAVLMYARYIDQLDALGPLVERVVNKHVALQVQAEHYPLVGECLLASIAEVLGAEVATTAVLQAWGAAYGQLATLLIGAEAARYREIATQAGGWQGARRFVLTRREAESADITSFYLQPADGQGVLKALPGQYLGLRVSLEGKEHRRNYSISQLCDGHSYRISVKHQEGGVVSGFLHQQLQVGDSVEVFPPAGEFVLREGTTPVLLLSAGVGITPTLPMLQAATAAGRKVVLVHCVRDAEHAAFSGYLQGLAAANPLLEVYHHYSAAQGHLPAGQLAQWLPVGAQAYVLGPLAFMAAMRQALFGSGVPITAVYHEFFGPAQQLSVA